jgi:hypothetical protein
MALFFTGALATVGAISQCFPEAAEGGVRMDSPVALWRQIVDAALEAVLGILGAIVKAFSHFFPYSPV